ncbi:MAG: WG repeat-containing protein [Crocinitomicaceae bacterium]|nr:WG repeat-containing protein [Crocinitomicaceae bacterium]
MKIIYSLVIYVFHGFLFPSMAASQRGMYAISVDDKWGYINEFGAIIVEPSFDRAFSSTYNYAIVEMDSSYELINSDGVDIGKGYDFHAGSIRTNGWINAHNSNNLYGCIDSSGTVMIPLDFKVIGYFRDSYARAIKGDQIGVVSQDGIFYDLSGYDEVKPLPKRDGCFEVVKNGRTGLYSIVEGRIVIEPVERRRYLKVKDGRVIISDTKKGGAVMDIKSGKFIIPFGRYESISIGHDSVYTVVKNKLYGFVDFDGYSILDCSLTHTYVSYLTNGLADYNDMAETDYDGYFVGLLDISGSIKLEADEYLNLDLLTVVNGTNLYRVLKNGKFGVINGNGELIVPIEFDDVFVTNGLFTVRHGESYHNNWEMGYYSFEGELIWKPSK